MSLQQFSSKKPSGLRWRLCFPCSQMGFRCWPCAQKLLCGGSGGRGGAKHQTRGEYAKGRINGNVALICHTRWAPASYKRSYNPYKWPYNFVTGVITLVIGVITQVTSGRGPIFYKYYIPKVCFFLG